MQAKKGILSLLLMGRQEIRVLSHVTVPWEDKCHNSESSPFTNPKQSPIPAIVKNINSTSAKTSMSCKREALCTSLVQEGKDVFSDSVKSPSILKVAQTIG